jgi:AraC-type transcriptional regulator N-terminus
MLGGWRVGRGGEEDVAIDDLTGLAAAVERHTAADGLYDTAVPGLTLFRSSAPSDHDEVVYVPCLCVIAQGAKEVVVGGQAYRYDPAQSLLVSVDLPAATRVVEASPGQPCLAVRIGLDSAGVGELLADGVTAPPLGPPARGLGVTPVEPPLLGAVTLRQIAAAGAPAHRIARAIGWLKDHFAEPARVEALARRVGLSPSAFHLHFKAVTGLSRMALGLA